MSSTTLSLRMRVRAALALSIAALIALSACQNSTGPGPDSSFTVFITVPSESDRFLEGANVQFSATVSSSGAADSVVWRSSRDGRLGKGPTIVANDLTLGSHVISATAFATGVRDSATVSIRIVTLPDVSILQPMMGSVFSPLEGVDLVGEAVDRDGGVVMLAWRSSIDGALGNGPVIQVQGLSAGGHTIWLVATDDESQSDSASVNLTILDFALGFDGLQDGASTPDHADLDLTTFWTIEMWVQPFDALTGAQHLVSKSGIHGFSQSFEVSFDDDAFFLRTWDGGGGNGVGERGVIRDSVWQHIAVVFNNGTVQLLVDGQVVVTSANHTIPQQTESTLSIGRFLHEDGTATAHFVGVMDEVRIWKVARTPTQINEARFTRLSGGETGLMAYWRMEEGEGDAVSDATGRGHTLQLGDGAGPDAADPAWHFPGADVR